MSFLNAHASAIFALIGAFGGSLLSFAISWFLGKRDFDLRVWDKLIERRIAAHEKVLEIALEMRVMQGLGGLDAEGEVKRAPQVLLSREAFVGWFNKTSKTVGTVSTWLSTEATRELNYLQDYLVTLEVHLSAVASEAYPDIGSIIRQDFVDISSSLERATYSFFENDVRRLKLRDIKEWHKYPREDTEKRLKTTRLLGSWQRMHAIAVSGKADVAG